MCVCFHCKEKEKRTPVSGNNTPCESACLDLLYSHLCLSMYIYLVCIVCMYVYVYVCMSVIKWRWQIWISYR